jgi:hypothetical protein
MVIDLPKRELNTEHPEFSLLAMKICHGMPGYLFIYFISLKTLIPWGYVARTKERTNETGLWPSVADHNKGNPSPSAVRCA